MTEPGNSTEPRTPTANVRALVEEVVKMIVDHPEEVAVEEAEGERGGAALNLRVAQTDVGKVIGKQGRTIRSLRNLVSAASVKQNRYYSLEIIEEEGEGNRVSRSRSRVATAGDGDDADGDVDGNTEVS
jgi:predicted RNA-binding protein YlqC (UPF0109 family)